MSLYLGCIADDFTGATDLANILVGEGLRKAVFLGYSCTLPSPTTVAGPYCT